MLVLSAVKPASRTSAPSARMSSRPEITGPCMPGWAMRQVPQCDQYTRMRSRTRPPSNSQHGTPSSLALASSRAFSIAPIPIAITPDIDWRACACSRANTRSVSCTRSPTTDAASRSTTLVTPVAPWCSSYSLQPTVPSSAVSLTKW